MHASFTLHICMYDISLPLHTLLYRLPSMFQNSGFQAFSVAFRHLKFTSKFKVYTLYWGGMSVITRFYRKTGTTRGSRAFPLNRPVVT